MTNVLFLDRPEPEHPAFTRACKAAAAADLLLRTARRETGVPRALLIAEADREIATLETAWAEYAPDHVRRSLQDSAERR